MKRKQLSMKSLYQYTSDFMNERYPQGAYSVGGNFEADLDLLKKFLDYIWKNPR